MVNKTIKIKLNVSNKLIYTILTIFIIAAITAGVYAYGTSNPSKFGHTMGEIQGLDGLQDARVQDSVKNLYVNSTGGLCYDYEGSSLGDCTTTSASCTKTGSISFLSPNGCASGGASACNVKCNSTIACPANDISGCYGAINAKYTSGTSEGCVGDTLTCTCSVSNKLYTNEVPGTSGTTTISKCL